MDYLKNEAAEAGDHAKGIALDLREEAGVRVEQAQGQVRNWYADAEKYVRQNPRECLLAALASGFVAGLLIRR